MTILVAADFDGPQWAAWHEALVAALPGETFVRSAARGDTTIDVALVANPPVGALAELPALRFVQSLWAGVDRLLADASVPAHLPIARMVDPAMNDAMAQTALWAVLTLHRDHVRYARQQAERVWRQWPQRRADEVGVLVLGLGEMGRTCARRLADNGYRVSGWSTRAVALPGIATHAGADALPDALAEADIVVNLLPLTDVTRGLFDARTYARMKAGSALVNLARGAHVVEADLIAALDSGRLARAVLDVYASEPLEAIHPFWTHPGITVLPHVAAQTDPRSAAQIAARNVRALRAGTPLAHLVDRRRGY